MTHASVALWERNSFRQHNTNTPHVAAIPAHWLLEWLSGEGKEEKSVRYIGSWGHFVSI
jgi:hypothetical protein